MIALCPGQFTLFPFLKFLTCVSPLIGFRIVKLQQVYVLSYIHFLSNFSSGCLSTINLPTVKISFVNPYPWQPSPNQLQFSPFFLFFIFYHPYRYSTFLSPSSVPFFLEAKALALSIFAINGDRFPLQGTILLSDEVVLH